MQKSGKLALWMLLSASAAGCSDSNDKPAPVPQQRSHYVIVTDMEVINVDNGQPVSVAGEGVFGSVQIDD